MSHAPSPWPDADTESFDTAPFDTAPFDTTSFDTELRRLVDRLRAMRVQALDAATEAVHQASSELLRLSAALGDPAPMPLPFLRPTALGDQLAVIGSDLRAVAVRRRDSTALATATEVLIDLRRTL